MCSVMSHSCACVLLKIPFLWYRQGRTGMTFPLRDMCCPYRSLAMGVVAIAALCALAVLALASSAPMQSELMDKQQVRGEKLDSACQCHT